MLLVKLTILSVVLLAILVFMLRIWCESNPAKAYLGKYPPWAYLIAILTVLDIVCIPLSVIWFLFIYL